MSLKKGVTHILWVKLEIILRNSCGAFWARSAFWLQVEGWKRDEYVHMHLVIE